MDLFSPDTAEAQPPEESRWTSSFGLEGTTEEVAPVVPTPDDYKKELDSLVSAPDFFDQPVESQIEAARKIYLGDDPHNPRKWQDEEDALNQHKETVNLIRQSNSTPVTPADYEDLLPPFPDISQVSSTKEAHLAVDSWEQKALSTAKANIGVHWDEIEEPATKQIAEKVDGIKRFITAKDFYGDARIEEGKQVEEPGLAKGLETAKEDLAKFATVLKSGGAMTARLIPDALGGEKLARKIETSTLLPDTPEKIRAMEGLENEKVFIHAPWGDYTESEFLDLGGSSLAVLLPGTGMAKLGAALRIPTAINQAVTTTAMMGMGGRIAYKQAYDKAFADSQSPSEASEAGWLNVPAGIITGVWNSVIAGGLVSPLKKVIPDALKIKILAKLTDTGLLGKGLSSGFEIAEKTIGGASAMAVQEASTGEAAAFATGNPELRSTKEEIIKAAGSGGLTGFAFGIVERGGNANVESGRGTTKPNESSGGLGNDGGTTTQDVTGDIGGETPPPAPGGAITETTGGSEPTPKPVPETASLAKVTTEKGQFETITGQNIPFERQRIPLSELTVQRDVKQFKRGADEATGVVGDVSKLPEKFDEVQSGNIVVLQKDVTRSGEKEVISGRNRLAIANRDPNQTDIPAIVVKESEGFSVGDAKKLDAELNIRDNQGATEDYAKFFEQNPIDYDTARRRGLLRNAPGARGFTIGTYGSPEIRGAFFDGRLNEKAAAAISNAAPGNEGLQRVGFAQILKGNSPEMAVNTMQVAERAVGIGGKEAQTSLFGDNEQSLRDAERLATTATELQSQDKQTLQTLKRAEQLGKVPNLDQLPGISAGINITDPVALRQEIARLSDRVGDWDKWATNPELTQMVQSRAAAELAKSGQQLSIDLTKPIEQPAPPRELPEDITAPVEEQTSFASPAARPKFSSEPHTAFPATGEVKEGEPVKFHSAIPARTRVESESYQGKPLNAVDEPLDMARLTPKIARIEPAPIVTDGAVKPTRDIIFDVAKATGTNIQYKGQSPRSIGTYFPGTSKTSIRYAGDLDTTAHELAHALDDKFGIVGEWAGKRTKSPYDKELIELFAPYGSAKTGSSLQYKRAEGVAEYMRAWVMNPEEARKTAPKFTEYFEKTLPKETQEQLQTFGEDIRRFAGARPEDKILANIRWEPDGLLARMKSAVMGSKGNGFEVTFYDKLKSKLTDSLEPFKQAIDFAKEEQGIETLTPDKDPMLLARLLNGINSKVENVFEDGWINARLERVTPGGFSWLFDNLDTSSTEIFDKEAKDTAALMVAEKTIQKAIQFSEEAAIAGEEQGLAPEKIQALREAQLQRKDIAGIGGGLEADFKTAMDAVKSLQQDPQRYGRLKESARRYRVVANANLQYLVDKGRMSQEGKDYIDTHNEHYVAMNRILELAPGEDLETVGIDAKTGKIGVVHEPIKKFGGSAAIIKNPYTSLMRSTANIMREADRNEVIKTFADLLRTHRKMYQGEPNALSTVGSIAKSSEPNTIPFWDKGEKHYLRLDQDLYHTLKGLGNASKLPGYATILPSILRNTVVYSPPFAIRNLIRDLQQRMIISELGMKTSAIETFKRITPMDLANLKISGGDQMGHYLSTEINYARALRTAMNEAAGEKGTILLSPFKISDGYMKAMEMSEKIGRVPEWRGQYEKGQKDFGYDEYQSMLFAADKSRGLLDFNVGGDWVKQITQLVPFTNAAVQGLRRTIQGARNDPQGFAVRWITMAVLPTMVSRIMAIMQDKEKELDNVPSYQRDLFHNFFLGDNLVAKIPKPFELGALASGVDRAISYARGNDKAWEGYGGSLARSFLPIDESAIAGPFKGLVEAMANKDFFRDRRPVPAYEENLDLSLRKTDSASRLGKLGQSLFEAFGVGDTSFGRTFGDARTLDFLGKEFFGNIADLAERTSNIGRKDTGYKLTPGSLIGLVSEAPAYTAPDVKWVYDYAERKGLGPTNKHLQELHNRLDLWHQADTPEKKEKAAARVREEAARMRKLFETHDISYFKGKKRGTTMTIPKELTP